MKPVMTPIIVSVDDLIDEINVLRKRVTAVSTIKGSTELVSFTAFTPVELLRDTGNPYLERNIWKLSKVSAIVGNFSYTKIINNRLKQEWASSSSHHPVPPRFVAKKRAWGISRVGQPFVEHRGDENYALRVIVNKVLSKPIFYEIKTDGKHVVLRGNVGKWVRKKNPPKTQKLLKNKVIYRDYWPENIREIKINGKHLIIR